MRKYWVITTGMDGKRYIRSRVGILTDSFYYWFDNRKEAISATAREIKETEEYLELLRERGNEGMVEVYENKIQIYKEAFKDAKRRL